MSINHCRLPATALIQPLAWEPPYTTGAALEKAKRQKKKKKKEKKEHKKKKSGLGLAIKSLKTDNIP